MMKLKRKDDNAIFVKKTWVRGVAKNRWMCPSCKERFNLALNKINTLWQCRYCQRLMDLKIKRY